MMNSSSKIVLGLLGGIFLLFLMREWWEVSQNPLRLIADKNIAILQTPSRHTVSFGETKTPHGKSLLRAMQPYFQKSSLTKLEDLEGSAKLGTIQFQTFSPRIMRANFEKKYLWFWDDPNEEDRKNLKKQPVSFESDFWILQANAFPDFFPLPTEGILFLGERKPSKKLETFARENQIPLVSVKETGGFLVEWQGDEWELKTRR